MLTMFTNLVMFSEEVIIPLKHGKFIESNHIHHSFATKFHIFSSDHADQIIRKYVILQVHGA